MSGNLTSAGKGAAGPGVSREALSQAVSLFNSGRLTEALAATQNLLKTASDAAVLHNLAAAIYSARGENELACESLQRGISIDRNAAPAHSNLGLALRNLKRPNEAIASLRRALELKPDYAEAHSNLGLVLCDIGKYEEAVISLRKALALKQDYGDAHNNLGNALKHLAEYENAADSYRAALRAQPQQAGFHNNLGAVQLILGEHDAAIGSFREAFRLKPDYAEAYFNLGDALLSAGAPGEAAAAFEAALSRQPDNAWAHLQLAETLTLLGQHDRALPHYLAAGDLDRDNVEIWRCLAGALSNTGFDKFEPTIAEIFARLLNWKTLVRPRQLVRPILRLARQHDGLKTALAAMAQGEIESRIAQVCADLARTPLLFDILSLTPAPDAEIEVLLTQVRRAVLLNRDRLRESAPALATQAALALHCFCNEYVFDEGEDEVVAVSAAAATVEESRARGQQADPLAIACIAAYRPLYSFAWAHSLDPPPALAALVRRQIDEVREEGRLRGDIATLAPIEDRVSQEVRAQYEENPYPRWVNTALATHARRLDEIVAARGLDVDPARYSNIESPDVLVAGCGTGQHAFDVASVYAGARVLAIDLSLSSLAYALRKMRDLEIANIEFMQADILELGRLDRQFDVIESIGVLHHMADPLAGWRALRARLKAGGLMQIGLYSELGRSAVLAARREIAARNLDASPNGIRAFRRAALTGALSFAGLDAVRESADFFSMSECRDLLFHVQEHRFTPERIAAALDALDLRFVGFELPHPDIKRRFLERNSQPEASYALDAWAAFERQNPTTFAGMYRFWATPR